MKLKIVNKGRKNNCIIIAAFMLGLLIIFALAISIKDTKVNKKVGTTVYGNSLLGKQNTIKLLEDKSGNIGIEENKIFKKYTISVSNTIKDVPYKQKNGYLELEFDKNISLKLNSSFNTSNLKDIYMTSNNGKYNLIIRTKYKDNNFVYVNDKNNNNEVVILVSKAKKPFKYKAVLNPGHGGPDPGEIVGNYYEKNITLKIVKLIRSDLEYNGVNVILTRDKDVGQALNDIADFVNKNKPDVFMSIHLNAMDTNPNGYQGIGAYYYDENGLQTNERIRLANLVLKHTTHKDGWLDDGAIKDRLRVLRLSKYPCTLVECGYLTNDNDRARLLNDTVLGNLANNLSDAIVEFLTKKN